MLYVLFACNDPLGSTGDDAPLVGRGVDTAVDRPDTGSTDTDTPIDTARDTAQDTARVDTATKAELERWIERILTAESLADVVA